MCMSVRASGLIIDTPTAFTQPSLGAPKGDKTRYGLIQQAAEAFEGEFGWLAICDTNSPR